MTSTNARRGSRRTATPEPVRLVSVIRVSRRKGRKGSAFMSPTEQRDTIASYVAGMGNAEVVAEFDETDSKSGKTTDRVGLNGAVEMILAGEADGLIVAKVDRFARTVVGGLTVIGKLDEKKKRFIAAAQRLDTHERDSMTEAMLTLLLLMAKWQLDSLTEGWENVRRRHIAAGTANVCPFGFRRDLDRRLEPDPALAEWVVFIFERRAQGWSYTQIADKLSEEQVKTPSKINFERWLGVHGDQWEADRARALDLGDDDLVAEYDKARPSPGGERWVHNQIKNILDNRTYLGELRSGGPDEKDEDKAWFVNSTAHPAIIPADLWEAVHRVTKTPAKRDANVFVLAGIIRCASCGGRMKGHTDHITPERHTVKQAYEIRYYKCRARFSWGRCPKPAKVRADQVEAAVLDTFENRFLKGTTMTAIVVNTAVTDAEAAVRAADAELDAWIEMTVLRNGRPDKWQRGYEIREAALTEAEEACAQAKAEALGATAPKDIKRRWEQGDEARRNLLSVLFPVVAVRPAPPNCQNTVMGERCRIFPAYEVPAGLPGRGVKDCAIRPIIWGGDGIVAA